MKPKTIVFVSDLHCGHRFGLCPPRWQTLDSQRSLWKHFCTLSKRYAKADVLCINGDCIEGKGIRNGGVELITTDRHEQADMAYECAAEFNAKKIVMTFGTPYHTGPDENFERPLADKLDAETIENRLLFEVNGLRFDVRHHAPGSSTPYGPVAGLQREKIVSLLDERTRRGDIIIRSHVHKFFLCQDKFGAVMTTPCLQTHTEFGARRCNGDVDLGFIVMEVASREEWSWKWARIAVEEFRREPMKL